MKKIKNVGLFVNTTKANAGDVVKGVSMWLEEQSIVPLLSDEQAVALGQSQTGISKTEVVEQADVLLVLGGDGTLLSAAHTSKIENVPILAINIGTLGFLTDASLDELYPTLNALLTGAYRIEHRMMLEVIVNSQVQTDPTEPQGKLKKPFRAFALNDVVIRHYTHLIELDAYVDGELFIPYNADGLIIATPSGSTGYSLSCAGTIVAPQLEAILLTPIAPHSLTVRPFIADGDAEITVEMRAAYQSVDVFVDGQRETHSLTAGAVIRVKKAERTIQLIRSQHHSYYRALREKLMYGYQPSAISRR
ncbi:NAD(+) kinase [Candidatus Poribacteria bacterium]|nr:MAG: NAD(+) kinase [Candidatus Poribacteria bacterium]